MLILWRMVGEQLRVGDEIKLTITDTRKKHVEMAIRAPKSIPVDREEIYRKKRKRKSSVAKTDSDNPDRNKRIHNKSLDDDNK